MAERVLTEDDEIFTQKNTSQNKQVQREILSDRKTLEDQRRKTGEQNVTPATYTFSEKFKLWRAKWCCHKKTFVVIKEYERAIVFRFGRMIEEGAVGPGTIALYEGIEKLMQKVDMRERPFVGHPIKIMSLDNVPVEVVGVCFYEIYDPISSYLNVDNGEVSQFIERLSMILLRDAIAKHKLYEILGNKKSLQNHIKSELERSLISWGIRVTRVEMMSIRVIEKSNLEVASSR